jgi:hypothetical protein
MTVAAVSMWSGTSSVCCSPIGERVGLGGPWHDGRRSLLSHFSNRSRWLQAGDVMGKVDKLVVTDAQIASQVIELRARLDEISL